MFDYKRVYKEKTAIYDLLVSREDYLGNIFPTINSIINTNGIDIVEFGAGTGRLSTMLALYCRSILLMDIQKSMLDIARCKLEKTKLQNWTIHVSDHRKVSLENNIANLTIEGWAFGHLVEWNPGIWKNEINKALFEMERLLKSNGKVIIIETLGTGNIKPKAPTRELLSFYSYLEEEKGFNHKYIRTDYKFKSKDEAYYLISSFWGERMADKIAVSDVVPECTGIWWK